MGRIVPQAYPTHDSDTVHWLSEDTNFVVNFAPDYLDTHNVAEQFSLLLNEHENELRARYSVTNRDNWLADPFTASSAPEGTDPRLAYVYSDKMWQDLERALLDTSLALKGRSQFGGGELDDRWLGMHPRLASVYMSALADEMASHHGLYPVAANPLDHLASNGCTIERLAQALLDDMHIKGESLADNEVEAQMATVALSAVMPRNIADVSMERIVEFRNKYTHERGYFQDYIQEFVGELSQRIRGARSLDSLAMHLENEYAHGLERQLDDIRRRLNSLGIDTVKSVMNIQVTTPTYLQAAGDQATAIASSGIFALSAFAAIRDVRINMREEIRSTPAGYLLLVEENIAPASLLTRIKNAARRFFFRV
ncbi:MAG: DUF6236 family protein [Chloroflexi bacterium]|nr:DUF6236 family protein [Chloroflexota bacterium]